MKLKNYIAALLAAYMFTLLLMPCNDSCNQEHHDIPQTVQAAQDHHQADNDICSPFCFCTCCATSITIVDFPAFQIVPQLTVEKFSVYTPSFYSLENSSIWQPPKIS